MTALIAAVGVKALTYAATAIAFFAGLFVVGHVVKNAGAADQRAADAEREKADNAAVTKARSDVDGLSDAAVDDGLRKFQRK